MKASFSEVRDVLENYASAIHEQDVGKFISGYAPDIHVYDCWGDWECSGISPFTDGVTEWFSGLESEGVTLNIDFDDLVVEEGVDAAFVRCAVTFAAYTKSGEKVRQITNRFTFGLRKANGSWLISHEHSSLPIDMESGRGIFDLR